MELNKPIRHAKISRDMTVDQLVDSFSGCAFGAGRIYEAVDIYREMINDRD